MTELRDNIAEVIEDAIDSVHDMDVTHADYARAAAAAIIAALPTFVAPLVWVWVRADLLSWGEAAQNGMGGSYRMTWEFGDGPKGEDTFFTVQFNSVGLYSGWSFDADLAMAAANAHNAAAVVAAFTGVRA